MEPDIPTQPVTAVDGMSGSGFVVRVPRSAIVSDFRQALASETRVQPKHLVILCDGQPPTPSLPVHDLLASGQRIFFFNRGLVCTPNHPLPEWRDGTDSVQPVPRFEASPSAEDIAGCVRVVLDNCLLRREAVVECQSQQSYQLEALRMALRNLNNTMRRDKKSYDTYSEASARLNTRMEQLFGDFSNSIVSKLRETPLHESHAQTTNANTLADLLNEESERKFFSAHNQARMEWKQRRDELCRQHAEMYAQSTQVLERGKAVEINIEGCVEEAKAAVERVRGLVPLCDSGEVGLDTVQRIDTESHMALHRCRSSQAHLYKMCAGLLHEIMKLQSQVRQLDVRRSAQSHVSARLHEFTAHLEMLQRAPDLYSSCVKEVAHRNRFNHRVQGLVQEFQAKQTQLAAEETQRRAQFEREVPKDVAMRLISGLECPPLRCELRRVNDVALPPIHEDEAEGRSSREGKDDEERKEEGEGEGEGEAAVEPTQSAKALADDLHRAMEQLEAFERRAVTAEQELQALTSRHSELERKNSELVQRFRSLLTDAKETRVQHEQREKELLDCLAQTKLSMSLSLQQSFDAEKAELHTRLSTASSERDASRLELQEERARRLTVESELRSHHALVGNLKAEVASHDDFVQRVHGLMKQLWECATDLGLGVQSVASATKFPNLDWALEVVNVMYFAAKEQAHIAQNEERSVHVNFTSAQGEAEGIVVFERKGEKDLFLALGLPDADGKEPAPCVLSQESNQHISGLIRPTTRYIVGRVVETGKMRCDKSTQIAGVRVGALVTTVTVEVMQIDNSLPGAPP